MGFKALVFVGVALCIGYVSSALSQCGETERYFTCDPASSNYAIILGSKVDCPEKTICNHLYISYSGGKCQACLPFETSAGIPYTCTENGFTIEGQPFECPQYTKCETPPPTAALLFPPCKPQECTDKDWTCQSNGMVIHNEVQGYCKVGTMCNADYKYPCTPCIKDNDEGIDIYPNSGASGVIASTVILSIVAMCAIQL